MNRERDEIQSDIDKLLELDEWTDDQKKEFSDLVNEYPDEDASDDLFLASVSEAATLITNDVT